MQSLNYKLYEKHKSNPKFNLSLSNNEIKRGLWDNKLLNAVGMMGQMEFDLAHNRSTTNVCYYTNLLWTK